MSSARVLFCPQHGKAVFVPLPQDLLYDEHLAISPTHFVMFATNTKRGANGAVDTAKNETLGQYKGVVSRIAGDAIILKTDEETGEETDIEMNILHLLPKMLERDNKQRLLYLNKVRAAGGLVVSL